MSIKSIFKSFRMISLTATFTPWVACLIISNFYFEDIDYQSSFLSLIGILLLQLGVNLFNDVSDFKKGIDNENEYGGSGVLVNGELTINQVQSMAISFFVISSVVAYILSTTYPEIIPILIVGAIASFLYSLPFFGLKYMALGDLAVFIGCGPVLTYGFALTTSKVHSDHIIIGIFFGLMAIGILHSNNMEDITIDRSKKVKTLATIIGFEKSKVFLISVYLLSFASLLFISDKIGKTPLYISLLSLPLGFHIIRTFHKAKNSNDPTIKLLRIKAAQFHLLSGVLLCIGLGLKVFIY